MTNEGKRRRLLANIKKDIATNRLVVMYILGDESAPPFFYTIGRGILGLPELLLVVPHLHPPVGMSLLNELDRLMPQAVESGSLVDMGGNFPIKVIDANDPRTKDEFTCLATDYHGGQSRYRVQQVLCCDPQGRFPPNCAAPYDRQPVLQTLN